MSISTHVLDTSIGRPAAAVAVQLHRYDDSAGWIEISRAVTNDEGRVSALLPSNMRAEPGTFRLTFDVAAYFQRRAADTFYRDVAVEFVVTDERHCHVPLLISPYG